LKIPFNGSVYDGKFEIRKSGLLFRISLWKHDFGENTGVLFLDRQKVGAYPTDIIESLLYRTKYTYPVPPEMKRGLAM